MLHSIVWHPYFLSFLKKILLKWKEEALLILIVFNFFLVLYTHVLLDNYRGKKRMKKASLLFFWKYFYCNTKVSLSGDLLVSCLFAFISIKSMEAANLTDSWYQQRHLLLYLVLLLTFFILLRPFTLFVGKTLSSLCFKVFKHCSTKTSWCFNDRLKLQVWFARHNISTVFGDNINNWKLKRRVQGKLSKERKWHVIWFPFKDV